MTADSDPGQPVSSRQGARASSDFATTRWSVVLSARSPGAPESAAALEALCRAYWFPLYAYARRRGHAPHDAQDLTQEFFARLLASNWVAQADQAKGRFRTFLLTAMSRFLANEWDRLRAQKRGGGTAPIPLLLDSAETRYHEEPADGRTPEQAFERRWALALLEQVIVKLESSERADGRAELFTALKPCLTGASDTQPYAQLAQQLALSEAAVKASVHRLRQRYRELLRAEVAHTVLGPNDVDAEMRQLFKVLSR